MRMWDQLVHFEKHGVYQIFIENDVLPNRYNGYVYREGYYMALYRVISAINLDELKVTLRDIVLTLQQEVVKE
jgi:hypothetical protein